MGSLWIVDLISMSNFGRPILKYVPDAQLAGERVRGLSCPFENRKKYPDFAKKAALTLKKCALFVCIYGLNP